MMMSGDRWHGYLCVEFCITKSLLFLDPPPASQKCVILRFWFIIHGACFGISVKIGGFFFAQSRLLLNYLPAPGLYHTLSFRRRIFHEKGALEKT